MSFTAKISFATEISQMIGSIKRKYSISGWLEISKSKVFEIALESNC